MSINKAPRYIFDLVCPRCNRDAQIETENRIPPPRVSCGECLMTDVEVIELKIVRVTVTP